jgi:HPt (histidine-containing phosphotransfer) domain-containing protein
MKQQVTQANEVKVRAVLEKVWLTSRPEALSRLAIVEQFLDELRSGKTNEEHQANALSAAHRLAGSLGMFGLGEASSCAAEIEALLSRRVSDFAALSECVSRLRDLIAAPQWPTTP